MNMIERVAEALFYNDNPSLVGKVKFSDFKANNVYKMMWFARAKAAILAMREPTDEMRNEYIRIKESEGHQKVAFMDAEWERMIDAALKE